ncbi:MAG: DapH/DapD/GlmU-related protein [Methylococcaceae bacterium]|nr:DapH/DapD/GlmU-related protein [Methylococcaceae bacterium]MDZ4158090.1 DapH/DapD/GlmU-related protein [Methylococcales bacterium]MDP2392881.1 DapH/DapD/GlmU-related protein [Methylococcaceae bacterium]MDP3020409.1 DapH/DapD/GlmU-related protein [Methylococcaceae bacterium]MDP3390894.1 DapH/DapD/GlmU-related protein [Methylococcaceae bacterium]
MKDELDNSKFQASFSQLTTFPVNRFHPLVWINGNPMIGEDTFIGAMSEVNAKGAQVKIGCNCDIASFVSINVADSHKRCIGLSDEIQRRNIEIGDSVFIGSHSLVKGGAIIGHHSVVAAGTIVEGTYIPPYSLVFGNPMQLRPSYYREKLILTGKIAND